jgi:hypothetical protein
MNTLFKWFIYVWASYLFLLFITPARSLESTHSLGLLFTLGYVLTAGVVVVFMELGVPAAKPSPDISAWRYEELFNRLQPQRLLSWVSSLTVIGLGLHIYDKAFIMNIDFSQGIASARFEWLRLGAEREGAISSWASAAGHLLSNFYFAGSFLSILFWENLPKFKRYSSLIIAVSVMLIYAATMANRSVPFVFIGFCASLILLRRLLGRPALPIARSLKLYSALLLLVLFSYAIYVFSERAHLSNASMKDYTQSFFIHLGAQETPAFDIGDILPTPLHDLFYLTQLVILYIVHTQWTFDFVLTLPDTPGGNLFNTIYAGLSKLGVESTVGYTDDRAFKGVLLSLPGSAWYDFGSVGLFLVAISHGFLIYLSRYLLLISRNRYRISFGAVLLFILVAIFSLVSPLTSLANLMVFPFLLVSLASIQLLAIASRYRLRGRRYLTPVNNPSHANGT